MVATDFPYGQHVTKSTAKLGIFRISVRPLRIPAGTQHPLEAFMESWRGMKTIFLSLFLALLLDGCSSGPIPTELPAPVLPTSTPLRATDVPTSIPNTDTPSAPPTPTEWLPYNPNYTAQGCGEFTATLPVKDAENLSQLEISRKLFEIYLGHYKVHGLGSLCRLEDFKVENVEDRFANLAAEQNVDFVNTVEYSLRVKEAPTNWAAGNGELAGNGWINHKFLIIGVTKVNDEYVLKLLGTGP